MHECALHGLYVWECADCARNRAESFQIEELRGATPVSLKVEDSWEWLQALYPKMRVTESVWPQFERVELDFYDSPLNCHEIRSVLLRILHRSTWIPWSSMFLRRDGIEYVLLHLVRHP